MAPRKVPRGQRRRRLRTDSSWKTWLIRCFCALFLGAILFAAGLFAWSFQPNAPGGEGEIVQFEVDTDDKMVVVDRLIRQGLVSNGALMKLYVGVLAPGATFSSRYHLLRRGLSPRQLVQRLAEVGSRDQAKVVFPEGWTHLQMAKRLESLEICSALGFQAAVHDKVLLPELGIRQSTAEGRLFPATYTFGVDTDPRNVVRRLVKESDSTVRGAPCRPAPRARLRAFIIGGRGGVYPRVDRGEGNWCRL